MAPTALEANHPGSMAKSAENGPGSLAESIAAARAALQRDDTGPDATRARAAIWHWDLAGGRVEWDEGLGAFFGYPERVTDSAWRRTRIHPEDRERVELSLQRATIVNHGGVWSARYRFRRADGSFVSVAERAYVIADEAGPRAVLGAIAKTAAEGPRRRASRSRPARSA
jgi:PAS domain S-box-containing protein